MMLQHTLLIACMVLVTVTPRLMPLVLYRRKIPLLLQQWMQGASYAALAALIFPGVLMVDTNDEYVGAIGLAASIGLSLLRAPVYLVVLGAVIVIYGYYHFTALYFGNATAV